MGDFKEKAREKIHIKFFIGKKIKRDVGFRVKTCRYRQVLIEKSIFTYLENKKVQAHWTCTFTSKKSQNINYTFSQCLPSSNLWFRKRQTWRKIGLEVRQSCK